MSHIHCDKTPQECHHWHKNNTSDGQGCGTDGTRGPERADPVWQRPMMTDTCFTRLVDSGPVDMDWQAHRGHSLTAQNRCLRLRGVLTLRRWQPRYWQRVIFVDEYDTTCICRWHSAFDCLTVYSTAATWCHLSSWRHAPCSQNRTNLPWRLQHQRVTVACVLARHVPNRTPMGCHGRSCSTTSTPSSQPTRTDSGPPKRMPKCTTSPHKTTDIFALNSFCLYVVELGWFSVYFTCCQLLCYYWMLNGCNL